MRILVTGGHEVVVLDNFDPFCDTRIKEHTVDVCRERAEEGDGSYRLVEGDVRDADLVSDLVEEAEYVYHQAAQARVPPGKPFQYYEVNVNGTLNVREALNKSDLFLYGTPGTEGAVPSNGAIDTYWSGEEDFETERDRYMPFWLAKYNNLEKGSFESDSNVETASIAQDILCDPIRTSHGYPSRLTARPACSCLLRELGRHSNRA